MDQKFTSLCNANGPKMINKLRPSVHIENEIGSPSGNFCY